MYTIHLWDNSTLIHQEEEPVRPKHKLVIPLRKGREDVNNTLRSLSSSTIGELMADEECEVMVWPNSFNEGNDELKEQYIFRITEKDGKTIDSVTTNNVVGFIGRGNTDIRIHSRFASSNDNDFFLYYMLEKVMSINTFSLSSSGNEPEVFDFLMFFFPRLLKDALSQGLYKKYVYHEYNDANIRGVVDVNRHIRLNIPANGKIAYRTREFSYDNSMTQLIRHTIEFIRRKQFGKAVLHNDPDTEGCVRQIIQATPTFQMKKRQTIINENLRPLVHPYYTKYAALQNLCLRILRYERISFGQDSNNKIHGLLIDAAWLWEEYIAQVLSEGTGMKHYTRKHRDFHLFEPQEGKPFQQIIPDYYDEEKKIVADAKYVPLNRYDRLDAERAAPIYYKTVMYMYRFNTQKGFLFHPVSYEEAKDKSVEYSDYNIEGREGCHLYEMGLVVPDNTVANYAQFKEKMQGNGGDIKGSEKEFVEKVINVI